MLEASGLSGAVRSSVAAALAAASSASFLAGPVALTVAAFAQADLPAEQPPWLAFIVSIVAGTGLLLLAVRIEGTPPRRTFLRRATLPGGLGAICCLLGLPFSCGPHPDPGYSGFIAFCVSALYAWSFLTALRQVSCREDAIPI